MTARVTATARAARRLALALAFVGGACASRPENRAWPVADDAEQAAAEQRWLASELAGLQAAAVPDCGKVCALGGRICALARQICALATQVPHDAHTQSLCHDAEGRCSQATAAARPRCACAAP